MHENPELSRQEKETSALVAGKLKKLSFAVTDHFGQYTDSKDLVRRCGRAENGAGAVVYVPTDMDAPPVAENTGLACTSKVWVRRGTGKVGVTHVCGHDLHMIVFLGTTKMLAETKSQWIGTVVMIGQPAEESAAGAAAMMRAGLYAKFPKPDDVLALHGFFVASGGDGWLARRSDISVSAVIMDLLKK